jgi:Zn-dependent protease
MTVSDESQLEAQNGRKSVGAIAGIVAVAAAFLLKFKVAIFAAFKAIPLLKFGWIVQSFGSMFLSLGLYAVAFGWRYAITLIGLIYVHELGHFFYMHFKGLKPKAPVFMPFLGAYVAMTNLPKDPVIHAWSAYFGPLIGGAAAWALYAIGMSSGNHFLVAAANTGFMLNLFQLLPIRPFDGGFLADCISKWLAIPGLCALVYFALQLHSVLMLVICGVSVLMVFSRWNKVAEIPVSLSNRALVTAAYFGLAAALGWLYFDSGAHLHRVLQ